MVSDRCSACLHIIGKRDSNNRSHWYGNRTILLTGHSDMRTIRRSLRRNRKNFRTIGWATTGFIFVFGILTVQLLATEGRRPLYGQDSTPPPAPVSFNTQRQTPPIVNSNQVLRPAAVAQPTPSTGNTQRVAQTYPPQRLVSRQFAPQAQAIPQQPFAFQQYGTPPVITDPSASPSAVYLQQQPYSEATYPESISGDFVQEVVYESSQATPSSNYFGIGPDDVCDEWNGFGDCDQKMFTRRGAVCSDKDCLGQNSRLGQRFRSERGCR